MSAPKHRAAGPIVNDVAMVARATVGSSVPGMFVVIQADHANEAPVRPNHVPAAAFSFFAASLVDSIAPVPAHISVAAITPAQAWIPAPSRGASARAFSSSAAIRHPPAQAAKAISVPIPLFTKFFILRKPRSLLRGGAALVSLTWLVFACSVLFSESCAHNQVKSGW